MSPSTEAAAGRWLSVAIKWEKAGKFRLAGRLLLSLATDLLSGGWTGGTPVWRRSTISVIRRDNGSVVMTFDHTDEQEAVDHFNSLAERLQMMRLWDFCRDLGVPFDAVADAVPIEGE